MNDREYCIGTVIVNDQICELWRRSEKHELGSMNGEEMYDNWWVRVNDQWVPWLDKGSNRVSWEINIKQGNRTKEKWGETDIRTTGHLEIFCNKYKVYDFGFGCINWAMNKAQTLMVDMMEHPFDFTNPEKEIGRKVWYYDQPAVVSRLILDQGCIMLKKEDGTGFVMSKPWDQDDEMSSDWDGENEVKDDVFAPTIWWFRK